MNAQPAVHPADQTLHAYGLGQLDDSSSESVSKHLESCPDCRRRVAEVSSDSFLGRLRDAKPQPDSFRPAVSSTDGLSMLDAGAAPAAPPPASTLPPELADRSDYEILRELGRGGMGVVYLARNTLMGRLEVLKVVSGHLINRRGVLDRFQGEIRNAARLHHPNIVTAYSAFRLGESLVLAMEYVEGLDLTRMLKARGPLLVANACSYVHQAALGLQHAHEHGMVHRDIKPSNLMLTRQGNRAVVKVLDFGLAKVQSEGAVDGGLTHEGQMLGTPDYIAPEQISNARRADIRADIYSLGCTIYYLLTGKPPFRGDSLYDILQAHHSMDATPLNLLRPEVPVEVAAIVAKMMAKEPARRFQEPKEVAQALKHFFKSGTVAPVGAQPEVSQMGREAARQPTVREPSASIQPAGKRTSKPGAPGDTAQQAPGSGSIGESLVETREPRPSPAVAKPSRRRPVWMWPAVAASILLLGFVAAWAAGVFKVKTANGVIVVENVPADAVVEVDGGKVTITPKEGQPVRIEQPPGKYFVRVKRGGDELLGESVTIASGEQLKLHVRLERSTALGAAERATADIPPSPTAPASKTRLESGAVADGTRKGQAGAVPFDRKNFSFVDASPLEWHLEGDELVLNIPGGYRGPHPFPMVLFGDISWTDYDFTVTAKPVSARYGFAVVFRSRSPASRYEYVVQGTKSKECIVRAFRLGKEIDEGLVELRLSPNQWYTARVKVRGRRIQCFLSDGVDEVKLLDLEDDNSPNGQVGLKTLCGLDGTEWRFKNIKVTAPDGTVLWEGPPAIDSPLSEFAPGFWTNAVGEGGLAIVNGHFGRPRALRTCPNGGNPCILRAEVDIPAGKKTSLILDVSHHPGGGWQLVVRANTQGLLDEVIGPNTTENGWKHISIDLSGFAGRKVQLELLNQLSDLQNCWAYWGRIAIVSHQRG
jgi:Protein kinase domain/PEGA domain/Putative zinc-finger